MFRTNHIGKRRYGRLIYTLEGDQFQQRSAIAIAPGMQGRDFEIRF
jgi:hypothetical protein